MLFFNGDATGAELGVRTKASGSKSDRPSIIRGGLIYRKCAVARIERSRFNPDRDHRVVFFQVERHFTLTVPLSTRRVHELSFHGRASTDQPSLPSRREKKYFEPLQATKSGDERQPNGPLNSNTALLHVVHCP